MFPFKKYEQQLAHVRFQLNFQQKTNGKCFHGKFLPKPEEHFGNFTAGSLGV